MVLRFSAASLVLAILMIATSEAWAVDLTQQIDFKIPPQRLSTALLEFSHQAKVQIVVGPEVGERRTEGAVDTLGRLLASLPRDQ
jgi:hypothetical protein